MNRPSSTIFRLLLCTALLGVAGLRAADATSATAKEKLAGYEKVGFDKLASFDFTPPGDGVAPADGKAPAKSGDEQIPERIKAFDKKKVAVTGFMLPVKMDNGLVKEFLLVKDPMMCCYGVMPKVNEWIVVKMTGPGVKPLMDIPITFEGTLKVASICSRVTSRRRRPRAETAHRRCKK
jgi:hypothetical protein